MADRRRWCPLSLVFSFFFPTHFYLPLIMPALLSLLIRGFASIIQFVLRYGVFVHSHMLPVLPLTSSFSLSLTPSHQALYSNLCNVITALCSSFSSFPFSCRWPPPPPSILTDFESNNHLTFPSWHCNLDGARWRDILMPNRKSNVKTDKVNE